MAITQPTQTLSTTLLPEIASRVTLLTRTVTDNHDGTISTAFGVTIIPECIIYEVDANNKPTGIYERSDLPSVELTAAQVSSVFGLQVTPAGAGDSMALGDLLANLDDQNLVSSGITGTINTPAVTLPAVTVATAS